MVDDIMGAIAPDLGQSRALNSDVVAMVKLMTRVGPRIPEIARQLGRHKETVRYWYKKLYERGFAIQAVANHEALGLRRVAMKVRFEERYEPYVKPLMFALNEVCYVVSYAKTLPDDGYIIHASVPIEHVRGYIDLFSTLKERGVLKAIEFYAFDWVRNVPMKADYFDFENGRWDINWAALPKIKYESVAPLVSERARFDQVDLLLLKEMQADATRGLQEIHDAIRERDGKDINYKTLCWHLNEHIETSGLLKGYAIRWMGTRYDPVSDRVKQRQHSFLGLDVFVRNVSEAERLELMGQMNRLPLLWAEASGKDYFAELALPNEMITEGLEYLQSATKRVSEKTSFHMIDQKNAVFFTIPYKLYDADARAWKFNAEELLHKFEQMELEIKKE
jgi:DNA-binding Lrp family transcriptional regulator